MKIGKRALKTREIVLLVLLVLIFVALAYYVFFYKKIEERLSELDTATLEVDIENEKTRASLKQQMLQEIEISKATITKEIAVYDNLQKEIAVLYDIFGEKLFAFEFEDPQATDNFVRRNVTVEFWADSFEEAKDILYQLYDCDYLTLIYSYTIEPDDNDLFLGDNQTAVVIDMYFYETLTGAETTNGVIIVQD